MPQALQSLEDRLFYDDDILLGIDNTWSNNSFLYVSGWMVSKKAPLEKAEIIVDNTVHQIDKWLSRPALGELCAKYNQNIDCGFEILVDRPAKHRLMFKFSNSLGDFRKELTVTGSKPKIPTDFNIQPGIFSDFVNEVNAKNLSVLEIGSRVVSPGSKSKRPLFAKAQAYTGFDFYPDSNTDVVGDAHKLSNYFTRNHFDAVFSLSVFEHLAMPWLVAMEINKVLKIGGITYHSAPTAVPIHERPWDFWRYTEESLKVIFSKAMGFELIKTGYTNPARIYCDEVSMGYEKEPLLTTFRGVQIIAKKVSELDHDRFRWDTNIDETVGHDSRYPKKL